MGVSRIDCNSWHFIIEGDVCGRFQRGKIIANAVADVASQAESGPKLVLAHREDQDVQRNRLEEEQIVAILTEHEGRMWSRSCVACTGPSAGKCLPGLPPP